MRYIRFLLILSGIILYWSGIQAQSIAVTYTGDPCDSVVANFSLIPADVNDTITSISWNFGDGENASGVNNPQHSYSAPGLYPVSVLINSLYTLNLETPVAVYNSPDARFNYSDSLEIDSYTYLFKCTQTEIDTLSYIYSWNFGDGTTGSSNNILHTFPTFGAYDIDLIVEHSGGCVDSSSQTINVTDVLEIPNIFTPNMDGHNDFFTVRTNGVNLYEFSVYARTGTLVFRSENSVISWDGRSMSGIEMQEGVYFFIIKQIDGPVLNERNGYLHLIR